jgi:amino acid adenylation domain-containing protein
MSNPTAAGYRLSIQQERTWSHYSHESPSLWAESELELEGPLETAKLHDAIGKAVSRHEILRTVFQRQMGLKVPFQVILESPEFRWSESDLTGFNEQAQRDRFRELMDSAKSPDLEKGPALAAVLAKVSSKSYLLGLSLPALCADLLTLHNLTSEIFRSYGGHPAEEEVMHYADISEWQQELLTAEESKPGRDYWRNYCRNADFIQIENLLAGFEKQPADDFSPAAVSQRLLRSTLSAHKEEDLPNILLTAWLAFLSRMIGSPNIVVGCQFAGRSYAELAHALGPLAKVIPLLAVLPEGVTFNELLEQVRRDNVDFRNWQDSFSWSNTGIPPGQVQGPVLPFLFESTPVPGSRTYGPLKVTTVRQSVLGERFRLKLDTRIGREWLDITLLYDSGYLASKTIERWISHFFTLLQFAVKHPDTPIGQLPLLNDEERHEFLADWNQTAADFPQHCIHTWFEQQAARTPGAPAARHQDDCLTYRELNEQANQLAHFLRSKGVRANSLVGLCLDRSTSMMVAVLAILKAGGAYVPLSADHPKPRLAAQLANADALITEAKFECLMPSFGGDSILIDQHRERWSIQPFNNPGSVNSPEDLAYVIYTSGSTGTPKGVSIRHRNLVNYTSYVQRWLELEKQPQPLHFATVSTLGADLGNTCIYPSLVCGGCLHIIGHDVAADSQRFREYAAKYPFDVLKIVPSHLMALLNSGGGREVLPRKFLITGGEALTIPLVRKVIEAGGTCELLNHYGPTETTIGSLTLRVRDFDWQHSPAKTIPIGKPIANTRVYVLNAQGEPVPVGVPGELYIGGDGVSAGYIRQPELTAERFLPERFGPDANAKMYRTGDLVRYLPDGNIEFIGRVDDQVKIRGFRIELGEIESVLLRHAGVKQAVVLALPNDRGEKSLVAYVVGTAQSDELRTHLRAQLPDYMVPPALIQLAKFPLNANGKIDRQALPKPEDVKSSSKEAIAPRTPSEEIVASIWNDVLKRDDLGVEDNFFEIGGHSLLATQIASRLREHFHIAVPVRAVFESPSIAELAKRMDNSRRAEQGIIPPPITPVPRSQPMPLSFAQERLWVLDQIEPRNPLYNIPRTLRLRGALRVDSLERAINEIVRRHESQRTTFTVKDGHPVQVIASSTTISLVVEDLTPIPEAERENRARAIAIQESTRPFDLSQAPLVRAHLLRLGLEDHVLQLTMHHIISDAWSAGIFLQEMSALYEAFCLGAASPLPELKVQYADYAAQERTWLQGEVLEKQLAFWRERLKGVPSVLELPLDHARPAKRSFAGSCEIFQFPLEKLNAVKGLARQEGATLFMALMALYQVLLSRYSGAEQIVVGTDLANRTMPETERMIGFFINLLAVRTDLSGNPTFRELLGRVRDGMLESYAHQEVPFPRIVQEIQPERSATHNPVVQVLFVMQNVPRSKRELGGLVVEPFEVPVTTSKFDMALFVGERPDGLVGYWVYSTELFEQVTIQRMIRHWTNLLESAIAQPDARLSALTMLSPEELAQQQAEKKQRKHSQISKLKSTAPAPVGLSSGPVEKS